MKRLFAEARPFGPFIQESSFSAPVADIMGSDDTPCDRILNQHSDIIENMILQTETQNAEHAVIFAQTEGKMLVTDIEEGQEDAISNVTLANLEMDATMLVINDRGGGKLSPDTYKLYKVHTHPEGHIDMSLRDISSMGRDMDADTPTNNPHGNFVAVKSGDEVILHGLYRQNTLSENQIRNIKAYSSLMESDTVTGLRDDKAELVDVMLDNGYKACTSKMVI